MLNLAVPTRPAWAAEAVADIDLVLLDHAHCEKKAASTAMNLIFRYIEQPGMMLRLSALVREEMEHFELMLDVLAERGVPFVRLEPSPYASRLMKSVRRSEPDRLLDTLLCCALIEARSCERMKLLADALTEPALSELYRSLLASEARHHHDYVAMATERFGREPTRARLAELALAEADVLAQPTDEVRMHS
jgi:tRNA 2-(methylsulfanyl)-N6-isopentenyladenosine37 hydroxylase